MSVNQGRRKGMRENKRNKVAGGGWGGGEGVSDTDIKQVFFFSRIRFNTITKIKNPFDTTLDTMEERSTL